MLVTPAMGISPRWKRERIAISGSTRSLSGLIGAVWRRRCCPHIDKLRWVIEKIPAHKSVLVFSLVDLLSVSMGRFRMGGTGEHRDL